MKTACKKPTLERYASDAKLAIFTVRHCAASYGVRVKPTKAQLGLVRPFWAKITDRHYISAPTSDLLHTQREPPPHKSGRGHLRTHINVHCETHTRPSRGHRPSMDQMQQPRHVCSAYMRPRPSAGLLLSCLATCAPRSLHGSPLSARAVRASDPDLSLANLLRPHHDELEHFRSDLHAHSEL